LFWHFGYDGFGVIWHNSWSHLVGRQHVLILDWTTHPTLGDGQGDARNQEDATKNDAGNAKVGAIIRNINSQLEE